MSRCLPDQKTGGDVSQNTADYGWEEADGRL